MTYDVHDRHNSGVLISGLATFMCALHLVHLDGNHHVLDVIHNETFDAKSIISPHLDNHDSRGSLFSSYQAQITKCTKLESKIE